MKELLDEVFLINPKFYLILTIVCIFVALCIYLIEKGKIK